MQAIWEFYSLLRVQNIVRVFSEIEPRSILALGNKAELTLPIPICAKRGWKKAYRASSFSFLCWTRAGFFFFWQGFRPGRQSAFVGYLSQKKMLFFSFEGSRGSSVLCLDTKKNYEGIYASKGRLDLYQVFFSPKLNFFEKFFLSDGRIFFSRKKFFFASKLFDR